MDMNGGYDQLSGSLSSLHSIPVKFLLQREVSSIIALLGEWEGESSDVGSRLVNLRYPHSNCQDPILSVSILIPREGDQSEDFAMLSFLYLPCRNLIMLVSIFLNVYLTENDETGMFCISRHYLISCYLQINAIFKVDILCYIGLMLCFEVMSQWKIKHLFLEEQTNTSVITV